MTNPNLERWKWLDLTREPESPEDLVPRVLTPGWITLFSGAPGVGKSYGHQALVAAALTGGTWLGLPVTGIERILVVDEENPPVVAWQRLRALGVVPEHAERVRYCSQVGCRLGADTWADELLAIVAEFKPQLVIIDSAASATATAVNENDSISIMFAEVLRPLARLEVAVLLLHHHRKATGNISERILGGMQWEGQIDRHLAFDAPSKTPTSWSTPTGTTCASFTVKVAPGKSRHGVAIDPIEFTIESEQDADGRYLSIALKRQDPGAGSGPRHDVVELIATAMVEFLAGRPDNRAGLGEIVTDLNERIESEQLAITVKSHNARLQPNDGRVTKALSRLKDRGLVTKAGRGVYVLVD
jgi:hypothetical protein